MSAKPFPIGTRVGPYVLDAPLGTGATAAVHRAHDADGREIALKVRKVGVSAMDRRLLREFESMRTLRIPGVVAVHEAGVDDDLLWFSMDLVEGRHFLEAVHEETTIAGRAQRTLDYGRQLLEILGQLHQAGIIHRDVKPSNVLVDKKGRVQVLDFGIVRLFGSTEDTLSDTGQVLGTLPFMSPEQLAGISFDHRIDLFAAGLMLYECINGPRPRPATAVGWIPKICLESLTPLACLHREVPRELSKVIEQLTRVDPRERPDPIEAAARLRRAINDPEIGDWPIPPNIDTGDWWLPLEGTIGNTSHPPTYILEGHAGSGRRRAAEQVFRHAVMQGITPVQVACHLDGVGQPILEIFQTALLGNDDEKWRREVLREDGDLLRRMWPSIDAASSPSGNGTPPVEELAQAVVRCLDRISQHRALVIVFRQFEQVDPLTATVVQALAPIAGPRLGLLLIHEPRWASRLSRQVIDQLRAGGAGWVTPPAITKEQAKQISSALCPNGPHPTRTASRPQEAVEVGLANLAEWRRESWIPPDDQLCPLVVRDGPIPHPVFAQVSPLIPLDSPWLDRQEGSQEIILSGEFAQRAAESRLKDVRGAARALEAAWTASLGVEVNPADIAALRLRAGDPRGAWLPAARSACRAEGMGLYADARRWLLVLSHLPVDTGMEAEAVQFDLAYCQASTALRTEPGLPKIELVDRCEALAQGPLQENLARVLRAEYRLRAGEVRPALVTLLRLASPSQNPSPQGAIRALLAATHARFLLAQLDEVAPQLQRARELLAAHPEPRLEVQVANWQADWHFARNEFQPARKLLQDNLRRASYSGYVRGAAFAAARLGQVLRVLGKRREAEHQMRSAREAFHATSDLVLGVETALELANLRAERADAAGARHLLDDAIRKIRALGLEYLMERAMRIALQIAILRADASDASVALSNLQNRKDPETPSVEVRWWRVRGDTWRAMQVGAPKENTYGHVSWLVERARAAHAAGDLDQAEQNTQRALDSSTEFGFSELQLHASLLQATLHPTDPAEWKKLQKKAAECLSAEVYISALELDARRLEAVGDITLAKARWRALRARAEELGFRPGVEEAMGWLQA